MRTSTLGLSLALLAGLASAAGAEVVVIPAARDNTLYEDADGTLSNGAGEYLFAGNTVLPLARRGLVAFDVAGSLPADAVVQSARLTLTMSRTIVGPQPVSLHRVLAGWGEGTSDALGEEGDGAPATAGDVTWLHTFYPGSFWALAGGDFAAAASALTMVDGIGVYTWGSTPEMVADVQSWLDDPGSDHGWLLAGEEGSPITAKRFNSRENLASETRPALEVVFTTGAVVTIPTLSARGLALLTLLLSAAALLLLRRTSAGGAGG